MYWYKLISKSVKSVNTVVLTEIKHEQNFTIWNLQNETNKTYAWESPESMAVRMNLSLIAAANDLETNWKIEIDKNLQPIESYKTSFPFESFSLS